MPVCRQSDKPSAFFQNFGCCKRTLPIIPEGCGGVAIKVSRANYGSTPVALQPVEQPYYSRGVGSGIAGGVGLLSADALEFPDGQLALLTSLEEGQEAVVLQLPTLANNASEVEAERRVAYVG